MAVYAGPGSPGNRSAPSTSTASSAPHLGSSSSFMWAKPANAPSYSAMIVRPRYLRRQLSAAAQQSPRRHGPRPAGSGSMASLRPTEGSGDAMSAPHGALHEAGERFGVLSGELDARQPGSKGGPE